VKQLSMPSLSHAAIPACRISTACSPASLRTSYTSMVTTSVIARAWSVTGACSSIARQAGPSALRNDRTDWMKVKSQSWRETSKDGGASSINPDARRDHRTGDRSWTRSRSIMSIGAVLRILGNVLTVMLKWCKIDRLRCTSGGERTGRCRCQRTSCLTLT
jgi:hypothetical protein